MIVRRAPAARGASFRRAAALLAACGAAFASLLPVRATEQTFRPLRDSVSSAFTLPAVDRPAISLDAQRGRIVLLHFFATWCEPCREELPALNRFAARADGEQVSILAISVAELEARVRRFLAATPVNVPVLLDEGRAAAKGFGVAVLPSTITLNRRLEPRLMVEGDFAWDGLSPHDLIMQIEAGEPTTIENEHSGGKP